MTLKDLISLAATDGKRTGCAVYALEHVPSGRRLISMTRNFSKRYYDGQQYLTRGTHHNAAVQADLTQDGANAFRFILLELVERPDQLPLLKRLHVEHARRRGLCYNPPDPQSRRSLANELLGRQRGAGQDDPLGQAIDQLKIIGEMSRIYPRAASLWLALPPEASSRTSTLVAPPP